MDTTKTILEDLDQSETIELISKGADLTVIVSEMFADQLAHMIINGYQELDLSDHEGCDSGEQLTDKERQLVELTTKALERVVQILTHTLECHV